MSYKPKSQFQKLQEIAVTTIAVKKAFGIQRQPYHSKGELTSIVNYNDKVYYVNDVGVECFSGIYEDNQMMFNCNIPDKI